MTKFKNTYRQFLKYLKDQLSNTERHDFEKSIQKDPFEQEALEGFELLKGNELEKDMLLLDKQIQSKVKTKIQSFNFYKLGLAASVIVLLGIGILFLNKEKEKPTDIVYDINKEELPSVKLEKQSDTIQTEIVYEEVDVIEEEIAQDSNTKSTPAKKDIYSDKAEKKITVTAVSETNPSSNIADEEIVLEENLIPESTTQKIKTQAKRVVISIDTTTSVEGVVTGLDGLPLPGVNVKVISNDTGVVSDFDGKYILKVKQGDTLEFSGLGFETKEILAGNHLKVSLEEDIAALDEVAVVGYGTTASRKNKKGNTKSEKTQRDRIRKIKKSKVRVFRLKRGIGVKKRKTLKRASIQLDSAKIDTTKTKKNIEPVNTIEDFGKWIDLKLNSSIFEPRKLYYFEISFEINDSEKVDHLKFHSTNDYKTENELRRVLLSAPSWILDVFNDREPSERINMELQVMF